MRKKSAPTTFVGLTCLPTSTKYHVNNPPRSNAFKPEQYAYVLESTNPDDLLGGPVRVVLTSPEPLMNGEELLALGDAIKTKHFNGRKALPARKIVAVRTLDGKVHGDCPAGSSYPHWELAEGEAFNLNELEARIAANRARTAG